MLASGTQLIVGLSVEAWTALGSVAAAGTFLLAALQALSTTKPEATVTPIKPTLPKTSKRDRQPELFLLHEVVGLSVSEIALATGAASSTVHAWLAGKHRPTGRRAQLLKSFSDLAIDLLVDLSAPEVATRLRQRIGPAGQCTPATERAQPESPQNAPRRN